MKLKGRIMKINKKTIYTDIPLDSEKNQKTDNMKTEEKHNEKSTRKTMHTDIHWSLKRIKNG